MSNKPSRTILSTFSEADKDRIALLYSYRKEKDIASKFTNAKARLVAEKGNILFALSAEYKTDISTLTAICRERGVITSPPKVRTPKPVVPTNGWFKPIGCDFRQLVKDFLASGRTVVEIEPTAPEFQGLKFKEIYEGFKGKHGVVITNAGKRLILSKK